MRRPELRPCGTTAARERHRYRREVPCTACLAADAERKRRERAQRSGEMTALFQRLVHLIATECRHAGMLP